MGKVERGKQGRRKKAGPVFDQAGLTRMKTRKAGPHRDKRRRRERGSLRRTLDAELVDSGY